MFEPEVLALDDGGYCLHSDLEGISPDELQKLVDTHGKKLEFQFTSFFSDAPPELREKYAEGAEVTSQADAVRAWRPSTPAGGGWYLIAIFKATGGPRACFTRPK